MNGSTLSARLRFWRRSSEQQEALDSSGFRGLNENVVCVSKISAENAPRCESRYGNIEEATL